MSFGWSAGDIATGITVIYNLIQALDSCDGAASDYRETVSFLHDLKRTLEPLQTFTACNAYPAYGRDIGKQVGQIKGPVEQFLSTVQKYEPSLGASARDGHHRHVVRKLQWYMFMSKKALGLKKKIESHMRIIDTLMQRLTLDLVWTTQQKLPDTLRATFRETLRPEFIAVLQEYLPSLNSTILENYQDTRGSSRAAQDSRLLELYEGLASGVEEIKQQMSNPEIIKQRIESCLRGDSSETRQKAFPGTEPPEFNPNGNTKLIDQSSNWIARRERETMLQESLKEAYYLVFLALCHFLQSLFLAFSRVVQPSRALMPTLLAKYNISFFDAIGRPPRILPYEYFRSFRILQAFIQYEFKDFPGSTWVDQGRYLILNGTKDRVLNESNWGSTVFPGTTVSMFLLLRKHRNFSSNLDMQHCPESSCPGTWIRSKTRSWAICPVCQKEVLNSMAFSFESDSVRNIDIPSKPSSSSELELRSTIIQSIAQWNADTHSQESTIEENLDNDVSMFKRVVQQFEIDQKTSPPITIATSLGKTTPRDRIYSIDELFRLNAKRWSLAVIRKRLDSYRTLSNSKTPDLGT